MNPEELAENFLLDTYNGLSSVETADAEVRQNGALRGFLDTAANIFISHNMHHRFGVGLLHRHNQCAEGERMVQYREVFRGADALVTRPVRNPAPSQKAVPTVWSLDGDTFHPLEYTTDALAADLLMSDEISDEFVAEFQGLVQSSPIGKFLGLAVVSREFYADAKPNEIALEYGNLVARSNVILHCDPSAGKVSIETAWRFKSPHASGEKVVPPPTCVPMSVCDTTTVCVTICHKGDGTHSGEQVHTPKKEHSKVSTHLSN